MAKVGQPFKVRLFQARTGLAQACGGCSYSYETLLYMAQLDPVIESGEEKQEICFV